MNEFQREYLYAHTQGNYRELVWNLLCNRRWLWDFTPGKAYQKWVENYPEVKELLHARQGVPEMGRELPRGERVVGILMSFMGCLLKERCACEWEFLVIYKMYIYSPLLSL